MNCGPVSYLFVCLCVGGGRLGEQPPKDNHLINKAHAGKLASGKIRISSPISGLWEDRGRGWGADAFTNPEHLGKRHIHPHHCQPSSLHTFSFSGPAALTPPPTLYSWSLPPTPSPARITFSATPSRLTAGVQFPLLHAWMQMKLIHSHGVPQHEVLSSLCCPGM